MSFSAVLMELAIDLIPFSAPLNLDEYDLCLAPCDSENRLDRNLPSLIDTLFSLSKCRFAISRCV